MNRAEQTSQLSLLPQLQSEIDERDHELANLRNSISILETRFGDSQQRLESVEKQNAQIKLEYEQKLEIARQDVSQSTRSEVLSLQESNENLKMLLSTAEKKYTRLADMNSELQKKLDTMEQQKRLQNDQMCGWRQWLIVDRSACETDEFKRRKWRTRRRTTRRRCWER